MSLGTHITLVHQFIYTVSVCEKEMKILKNLFKL